MADETELKVNFPACLEADFPHEMPAAERAVDDVLNAIDQSGSFKSLEDRSPGLRGNDWSNYLRCSEARMAHAARLLHKLGLTGGRVLDYGAYFGNFALMFQSLGFTVDAADSYRGYAPSLDRNLALFADRGIGTLDFADVGRDLGGVEAGRYDVVLCMGVIEHVPHTPRVLLEPLDRVLKPGGVLIIDTPNLVHLFNRQKLARGESVWPPIAVQYHAEIPFEGHHREYTPEEVVWMAEALGHQVVGVDLFNYSVYGYPALAGRDVSNQWRMVANPSMREIILCASRKPLPGETPSPVTWQDLFEDVERHWLARLPATFTQEDGAGILGTETLVADLQRGVNQRDASLQDLQARHLEQGKELSAAFAEIGSLMDRLGALQFAFDMTPVERLKRLGRRLIGRGGKQR